MIITSVSLLSLLSTACHAVLTIDDNKWVGDTESDIVGQQLANYINRFLEHYKLPAEPSGGSRQKYKNKKESKVFVKVVKQPFYNKDLIRMLKEKKARPVKTPFLLANPGISKAPRWTYRGRYYTIIYGSKTFSNFRTGFEFWPDVYPECRGSSQSPVNIDLALVQDLDCPPLLFLNYDRVNNNNIMIVNNGRTLEIELEVIII